MIRVLIEPDPLFEREVQYSWDLFCRNKGLDFTFTTSSQDADVTIGTSADADVRISRLFYQKLSEKKFYHSYHLDSDLVIKCDDGQPDYLSTAFYMVNSVQEKNHSIKDVYGRFPYTESYQFKYNCVIENLVQNYFDRLVDQLGLKKKAQIADRRTRIFLSHDIDTIYGSLLQDVFHSVKKLNPLKLTSVLMKNIGSPYWLNMSEVMDIESSHGFKSTFFWLTRKGRVDDTISNSDYVINDKKIRKQISDVASRGFFNGLHKSAAASGLAEERSELGVTHRSNRYHYLKFNPPDDYRKIEDAGFDLDTSLGFAESHGFRNSYGLPFRPFDFAERKAFRFVEMPLHVMDGTFFKYKKVNADAAFEEITKFVSANSVNCMLTILFHNSFISDFKYRDFKKTYIDLLNFFNKENFACVSEDEIIRSYLNGN